MHKQSFLTFLLKPALAIVLFMTSPAALYAEETNTETGEPVSEETTESVSEETIESVSEETTEPTSIEDEQDRSEKESKNTKTTEESEAVNDNLTNEDHSSDADHASEEQRTVEEDITENAGVEPIVQKDTSDKDEDLDSVLGEESSPEEMKEDLANINEQSLTDELTEEMFHVSEKETLTPESEENISVLNSSASDFVYSDNGDGTIYITDYIGNGGVVDIPSVIEGKKVTEIGDNAFERYENIISITIPTGVIYIGFKAFCDCKNLKSIVIPEGVKGIGERAFEGCESLQSIHIPASCEYVSKLDGKSLRSITVAEGNPVYDSRNNCNAIIRTADNTLVQGCANTVIPSSVTTIEYSSFYHCGGMKSVVIPEGVTKIGTRAFYQSDLESITIPASVTEIEEMLFGWCENLNSIVVNKNNPVYDSRNNCNAIIETSTNILIEGCNSTKVPDTVTEIGRYAFYQRFGLKKIIIPDSVKRFDYYAFADCDRIEEFHMTKSVRTWEHGAMSKVGYYVDGIPILYYYGTEDNYRSIYRDSFNDHSLKVVFVAPVESITLSSSAETMEIGSSKKLSATVKPSNATIKWESSNTNVVQVDTEGNVTATGVGSATVSVGSPDGSKTAQCKITVTGSKPVDMHRMYNPNSGEHFYTGNIAERDFLISVGWNYEGVGFKAPKTSNTPMYRLYNPNAGDHHYTYNKAERDYLINVGWNDEGIGWYADDNKEIPQYRLYNPNATGAGSHHYTDKIGERDYLISIGWKDEGIGFYTCR